MCVIKHTAESGDHNFRSSPRMLKREQCALLLYLFTICVIAADFSSGRTPSLLADVLSAGRVAFPIHTFHDCKQKPQGF